ncbi:MAG: L-threonylcarbamoyladenylate synthase [Thiobacillus sp.]
MSPHGGDTTRRLAGGEAADIACAANILRTGGLVAFPTETVYGLGADATNDQAVGRIFEAKGRPPDHPLIVHVGTAVDIRRWARDIPEVVWKLASRFWPGPLTLILKRLPGVAEAASGGLDTIGLRVPAHPVAQALLKVFAGGIAAPSANRFGRISPTRVDHALAELQGRIDAVIDGGPCQVGLESTILDLSGPHPQILRPGAVTADALVPLVGALRVRPHVSAPRVPGSLEAHYSPVTPLRLVDPARLEAEVARSTQTGKVAVLARHGESAPGTHVTWIRMPDAGDTFGHDLYAVLRDADALGCTAILIEQPPATPEWEAVNDRLRRAAAGSGLDSP